MGASGDAPILATVEALSVVDLLSGFGSIDVLRAVGLLLDPGIIGLDAGGRVLLANEPARRLLGLPLADGSDFVAGEVDYRLIRLLDAARQSGHVEERAITLHDRDFNARAIALNGEVATLLMVRDETRVHHLERVRRDFVSNVSHELRTPITAVQLIAETLANGGLDDPAAAGELVRPRRPRRPGCGCRLRPPDRPGGVAHGADGRGAARAEHHRVRPSTDGQRTRS